METQYMIKFRHLANLLLKPFPDILWRYPANENAIYLTFDDGPYPPVTEPLLDFLNDHDIPATFFLSGENIFRYRHQIRQLDYSPHQLGSHYFHHFPLWGLSPRKLRKGILLTDRLISELLRQEVALFRPPYGIFSRQMLPVLQECQKRMVLWSIMAYDFKWSRQKIIHHLFTNLRPGDIILLHDSPKTANVIIDVLRELTNFASERGWTFKAISTDFAH
ncbi:MAG: polysaccharide deacetylase family protein [Calditrichaeota bacterium]|nr:MAG: polysaccharide deacetylase family protein [Calditrichota bacterium]